MRNPALRIEPFTLADIPEASQMTYATWGSELQANRRTKRILYEAMVRYYYRNGDYSYKVVDDKGMQAFLLAGLPGNSEGSAAWLAKAKAGLLQQERVIVQGYHDYLAYNSLRMEEYVQEDDVLLHLFISKQPGCGHSLLQQVAGAGSDSRKKGLLLWTDETCDYAYYRKNGFQQLDRFQNGKSAELGNLQTLIYRKII